MGPAGMRHACQVVVGLVLSSAAYGFAIGSGHSWLYACRNLVKFPLLILATAAICALAYFVFARFLAPRLTFRDVQRLVIQLFRDASVMLAGLSPVSFFLAMTMEQPTTEHLGEYPFFQGLNVMFIAVCGSIALVRQTKALLGEHGLMRSTGLAIITVWLSLSLFTGGQCCWYMRPFFGISAIKGPPPPFFLGTTPDFRGARSFYEAVYNLMISPPLPESYRRGRER